MNREGSDMWLHIIYCLSTVSFGSIVTLLISFSLSVSQIFLLWRVSHVGHKVHNLKRINGVLLDINIASCQRCFLFSPTNAVFTSESLNAFILLFQARGFIIFPIISHENGLFPHSLSLFVKSVRLMREQRLWALAGEKSTSAYWPVLSCCIENH